MEILLIMPHLRGGGAQRVAINLINSFDGDIFVTLLLINREGQLEKYIEKDVEIVTTKANTVKSSILELKRIIDSKKFDIIFTMKSYLGLAVWVATLLSHSKPPIVYREVIHQTYSKYYENNLSKTNNLQQLLTINLTKLLYKNVKKVITPSDSMRNDLINNFSVPIENIITINNPVQSNKIYEMSIEKVNHPWFKDEIPIIIGMGRLTKQKGFDILLKAVKIMKNNNIEVRLVILGEGEEYSNLENMTESLLIKDCVEFLGFQSNPYKYIAKANLFVLSSFYEGFPNALLEAMACNTPVISTNCESGPSEIINNNFNGVLVPVGDPEALANEIIKTIYNKEFARKIANKARDSIEAYYDVNVINKKYINLFNNIVSRN